MGLAGRIALALTVTVLVAVGVSALLVDMGLGGRVRSASEQRLRTAAEHSARLAETAYATQGRWSPAAIAEIEHAAAIPGYRAVIVDADGRRLPAVERAPSGPAAARSAVDVRSGGAVVGRLVLEAPAALLAAEEQDLVDRLVALHLLAAVLAVLAALLVVPVLSARTVRPIRLLRDTVSRRPGRERASEDGPREVADLARSFNALADALDQEESARRAMAADVAHELRTPLNGMLLRIEAAQDGVLPDPAANFVAMHAEAQRLGALIADVEQLADAERPGLLLDRRPLDLAELVEERVAVHRPAFSDGGIALVTELEPARVRGDAARLDQVIDNLLTNALRYTDPGGRVDVRVTSVSGAAQLEVADTGIGIEEQDLSHVFDRFWRADRSRSRATGGSGVGLAVVERLVSAHGGQVEVDSQTGSGTRFLVRMPLDPA